MKKYKLDTSVKAKPVMGVDDLLRVLIYHCAKDTSVFPNERQRVQLSLILLFAAYTSSRPAELVDAEPSEKDKARVKDLNWNTPDDSDHNEDEDGATTEAKRSKAICYEDIRLMVLRNPDKGGRPVVAMEVTLSHHKGVNRKSKP